MSLLRAQPALHCVGNAMEQIQLGKQDIVFAGGGQEEHWTPRHDLLFDAMGALSSKCALATPDKRPHAHMMPAIVMAL